jgi:hypothetical protein
VTTPTEALKNKFSRRRLVGYVLLAVTLLLVLRYFVVPRLNLIDEVDSFVSRILEAFSVALVTGLAIPFLAIWLGPDYEAISKINILDRKRETTPAFNKALESTGLWFFRGGMGSFFRKTTIPSLQKLPPPVKVVIVMLDIRNAPLLEEYAGYRSAQSGKDITSGLIRTSVLQSIWHLAKAVEKRGSIRDATVNLSGTFSSFRIDMSDSEVFLTQDNEDAPALRFTRESSYYKGFENEFYQNWNLSVDLRQALNDGPFVSPRDFFTRYFGINISDDEAGEL